MRNVRIGRLLPALLVLMIVLQGVVAFGALPADGGHGALVAASLALTVGLAVTAIVLVGRRVAAPLEALSGALKRIAAGDLDAAIPHAGRGDEVGAMAAAIAAVRDRAAERQRQDRESETERRRAEGERQAREAERTRESIRTHEAVARLGEALDRLAGGDMTCRIETPFDGDLERLRMDFNAAAARLAEAFGDAGGNARAIEAGATRIRAAADDLSRRTGEQAASVEETAAALKQITATVRDSAARAEEAGVLVARTRAGAEKSGAVVHRAVAAMQAIETSSQEISGIIGVIDEIAFQTNLLALNAGVEAARAGDAGRGFAVVAQEVRELAQRSARAAREIKTLITTSGDQVRSGVSLVGETGRALQTIAVEVEEIDGHVAAIVAATREQSGGLRTVGTAVGAMGEDMRRNAAMVEEATVASRDLAVEIQALNALIGRFETGAGVAERRAPHAPPHLHVVPTPSAPAPKPVRKSSGQWTVRPAAAGSHPVTSPARALGDKLAGAFGVRQDKGKDGDWEEF